MSACNFSCKSQTCKYIIYGYIRQSESEYKFARIISQSIMDICFMFWHQYLLQLPIPENASLFTLLFATYHLRDALLFKWQSINPLTQFQIATCFKLDHQESDVNNLKIQISDKERIEQLQQSVNSDKLIRFTKNITANVSIHFETDTHSEIYEWLFTIFSNLQSDNNSLSTIPIMEWTEHDLIISFMHFIIDDNEQTYTELAMCEFIEYFRRYLSCMMYNGSMICKELDNDKDNVINDESNILNSDEVTGYTPPPNNDLIPNYNIPNASIATSWWNIKVVLPNDYSIPYPIPVQYPATPPYTPPTPLTPPTPEYIVRKPKIITYGQSLMDNICEKYKVESVKFRPLERIFYDWLFLLFT